MRTIRRLYLYLVAVISLETVLWGMINLLRAMLDTSRVGGEVTQLAGALATLIVGLPVFLLHWWLIQRRIDDQPEERSSGLRAVFLYGLLLALLIPTAQNVLAMLNRFLIDLFQVAPDRVLFDFNQQTLLDNGIALVMNVLLAMYFMSVLRSDWAAAMDAERPTTFSPDNLILARRVFRYSLSVYALGLLVVGVQLILRYLFEQIGPPNVNALAPLANGLSLVLFAAPLWWGTWQTVQTSLSNPAEHGSLFRTVFLYLMVLVGMGTALVALGEVVFDTLQRLLGRSGTITGWLQQATVPITTGIAFSGLWAYHHAVLQRDLRELPASPRRGSIWRLYHYAVAFAGLMVLFFGLQAIGATIVDAVVPLSGVTAAASRSSLAGGLTALLIGLPLWLRPWLLATRQVAGENEAADRARRSAVRRAYLYLVIFIGVIGVMASAGGLIFEVLRQVLGDRNTGFVLDSLQLLKTLILFVILLGYHWQVLRRDSRRSELALAEKHSLFPVLVLDPGDEGFAGPVVAAIREETPEIPVAVHFASAGAPGEELSAAGAVVMPAGLAANPPEALRIWLRAFEGARLVVPAPHPGWVWIDAGGASLEKLGKQTAEALRRLAEGEPLEGSRVSAWVVVLAVIGGFFALIMLISLLAEFFRF